MKPTLGEFARMLEEHDRALRAYILGLVGNWHDAEEVVQETRVRLWEEFERYEPDRSFWGWARAIGYYEVLTFRKKRTRDRLVFADRVLEILEDEHAAVVEETLDRSDALKACMSQMPPKSREILRRCYSGEEKQREVAASLGQSFDGLRTTLYRIRKRLFDCINRRLVHEMD